MQSQTDRSSAADELVKGDIRQWLRGERRYSTVRHPYTESEFEGKHLQEICASLGIAGLRRECHRPEIIPDIQTAEELIRSLKLSYPENFRVGITKAWLSEDLIMDLREDLAKTERKVESGTSKIGEPVTLITLVFRGKQKNSGDIWK